jgi:hypothetical protein
VEEKEIFPWTLLMRIGDHTNATTKKNQLMSRTKKEKKKVESPIFSAAVIFLLYSSLYSLNDHT